MTRGNIYINIWVKCDVLEKMMSVFYHKKQKQKKKQLRVFKSRQWVYLRFGLKRILWPPDGARYYNIKPCVATVVSTIGYCVMQTCLQMQEQGGDQEEFLFVPLRNFPNLTPPITEFNEHQSKHTIVFCVLWRWGRAFTDLSTQSESLEQWLEAGASCPPTAYRKLLYVATPTPPRLLVIGAHMLHLLVCGSKHSIDLRQELPSRPPTANSLKDSSKLSKIMNEYSTNE